MPEWSIGAVSKTVDQLAWSQGSNPCLSAKRNTKSKCCVFLFSSPPCRSEGLSKDLCEFIFVQCIYSSDSLNSR